MLESRAFRLQRLIEERPTYQWMIDLAGLDCQDRACTSKLINVMKRRLALSSLGACHDMTYLPASTPCGCESARVAAAWVVGLSARGSQSRNNCDARVR